MSLLVEDALVSVEESWWINVGGRVYGPYAQAQLAGFVKEGRLAPHSIVRAGVKGPWITAIDDPVLGQLFVVSAKDADEGKLAAAGAGAPAVAAGRRASDKVSAGHGEANFVVIADIRVGSVRALEDAVRRLGDTVVLTRNAWLVRARHSAGSLRNALTSVLAASDMLFVVDASNNRTAWFNLGPGGEVQVRKVWVTPVEGPR